VLFSGNVGHQRQDILGDGYFDGILDQVPSREFKDRQDLPGLGKPHTGNGLQVIERQPGLVLSNQPGHLPGNRAHVKARRPHAENRRDKLLIGQGGSTLLPQLFARAAVFRHVLDGFQGTLSLKVVWFLYMRGTSHNPRTGRLRGALSWSCAPP